MGAGSLSSRRKTCDDITPHRPSGIGTKTMAGRRATTPRPGLHSTPCNANQHTPSNPSGSAPYMRDGLCTSPTHHGIIPMRCRMPAMTGSTENPNIGGCPTVNHDKGPLEALQPYRRPSRMTRPPWNGPNSKPAERMPEALGSRPPAARRPDQTTKPSNRRQTRSQLPQT